MQEIKEKKMNGEGRQWNRQVMHKVSGDSISMMAHNEPLQCNV
jgi:hypothetical protein